MVLGNPHFGNLNMLLLDHLRFAHPVVETLVDGAQGLHITLGNFFCPNPVSEPFPSSGISSSSHVRIMDIYIYIKNYWMDIYIYVCVTSSSIKTCHFTEQVTKPSTVFQPFGCENLSALRLSTRKTVVRNKFGSSQG